MSNRVNLNSQGNKKLELLSQGTYDFQNFGDETLFITDHADVKKSAPHRFAYKIIAQKALFCGKFTSSNE